MEKTSKQKELLSKWLKNNRLRMNVSQLTLANAIGLSESTIKAAETRRMYPSNESLNKMIKYFRLNIESVYKELDLSQKDINLESKRKTYKSDVKELKTKKESIEGLTRDDIKKLKSLLSQNQVTSTDSHLSEDQLRLIDLIKTSLDDRAILTLLDLSDRFATSTINQSKVSND